MLTNNLKFAFRNISRNKVSSFVNIIGLAMGICAFVLLIEYISLEKSVNKFHSNLAQTYRLINEDPSRKTWAEVEPGWAPIAKQRFAEIKDYCRFDEESGSTIIDRKGDAAQSFSETKTGYAEGNFFQFFSFALQAGSASSLNKPNVVFVSSSIAKKYFGSENAIGQTLTVHNQFGKTDYNVQGVYADMQDNSDIQFNMLFSLETLKNPTNLNGNDWAETDNLNSQYINTYFLLDKNVDIANLSSRLTTLRTAMKKDKDGVSFKLQPLADMHLGSSMNDNYPTFANIKYVYMLGAISFLILLIAWFNYVNLSTANSFKRANEVGVRKVIGASKSNLVLQFLGEALLVNMIALFVAVCMVVLLQPLFNQLVDKDLSLKTITASSDWIYGLSLLLSGSLISGTYTAFALAGYNPVETLKNKISKTSKGIILRKSLVVTQFTISIMLIIATILIYSQVDFMQHKDLGLNPDQLMVIKGPQVGADTTLKLSKSAFKNELSTESFVSDYCVSGSIPSGDFNFATSGFTQPASPKGAELKTYSFAEIGSRFLNTYQIKLMAGRNFTEQECAAKWNDNSKVLLNETAVKELGFVNTEDVLKTKIQWDERKLDVIGVVKDYNHTGAANKIEPVIFYPNNNSTYYTVRLSAGDKETQIKQLKKLYESSFGGNPFEYFFIDEHYAKLYSSETQYSHIFISASLWAIFIACLGLFGLTTFTVTSRIKEIGVRKVLGASVFNIVSLLAKDFILLIFIAFIIASPIAWIFMNNWLQDFAYHINIEWWVFVLAGLACASIAFTTICIKAIKAAIANPVNSLKTE